MTHRLVARELLWRSYSGARDAVGPTPIHGANFRREREVVRGVAATRMEALPAQKVKVLAQGAVRITCDVAL